MKFDIVKYSSSHTKFCEPCAKDATINGAIWLLAIEEDITYSFKMYPLGGLIKIEKEKPIPICSKCLPVLIKRLFEVIEAKESIEKLRRAAL